MGVGEVEMLPSLFWLARIISFHVTMSRTYKQFLTPRRLTFARHYSMGMVIDQYFQRRDCGEDELDLWGVCLDAGGNACATGGN